MKSVGLGIGSTVQAVQQAIAGLGVDLKASVVLERFLLQSGTSVYKRVDCRKLVAISDIYAKFHCELDPIELYCAKLSGIPESTVTTVLKGYVKLFLNL